LTRFKNGSTKALNLLRNSLSAPINTWIDFTFENEVETPNPENVKNILQAVERQFGKYTFEKDERSRSELKLIPKFTTSDSIFSGIEKIKVLKNERIQWATINDQKTDTYALSDFDLKSLLIKLTRGCSHLSFALHKFETEKDTITFKEMCDILTDQAVKIVRAREQEDEALKAKEQRNELNQKWTEETSSNSTAMMTMQQPVVYRRPIFAEKYYDSEQEIQPQGYLVEENFPFNAMATAAVPYGRSSSYPIYPQNSVTCSVCGSKEHIASACPNKFLNKRKMGWTMNESEQHQRQRLMNTIIPTPSQYTQVRPTLSRPQLSFTGRGNSHQR